MIHGYRRTIIRWALSTLAIAFWIAPGAVQGQVLTGKVFKDFNANRMRDATELGIAGMSVAAYDASGTEVSRGITDTDGEFSIMVPGGEDLRLEILAPPELDFLYPVAGGEVQVHFIEAGVSELEVAFYNPAEYCEQDPDLLTTCFAGGAHDDVDHQGDGAIVRFPSTASEGQNSYAAEIADVGSVYGLAFQRSTQHIFAGAFAKRHADWGPGGAGAIYVIDATTNSVVDTLHVPMPGNTARAVDGPSAVDMCDIVADGTIWNRDSCFFDAPGKEGLGDLELSDDETMLWTINLHNRGLYKLDVTPGHAVGDPILLGEIDDPGCPGGPEDWRPFALAYYDGELYVGGVCSGQTNNTDPVKLSPDLAVILGTDRILDVRAYVLRIQAPKSSAVGEVILEKNRLDFERGKACGDTNSADNLGACADSADLVPGRWHAWIEAWDQERLYGQDSTLNPPVTNFRFYPQPLLTDLEFAADGSMILGFRDRFADQVGDGGRSPGLGSEEDPSANSLPYTTASAGDIHRACFNRRVAGEASSGRQGHWVWEGEDVTEETGNVFACERPVASTKPDGDVEEFYWSDFFQPSSELDWHAETALGGLAQQGGFSHIAVTVMVPQVYLSGGIYYLHHDSGGQAADRPANGYEVYEEGFGEPDQGDLFGKAAGLGDVEYLCEKPAHEFGGRVWCDAHGYFESPNGVQDPGQEGGLETSVSGVTLQLSCKDGAIKALAVTGADGQYVFNDSNVIVDLPPGTLCTVKLDALLQASILGSCLRPTVANVGADDDLGQDVRDSDGLDPDGDGLVEAVFQVGPSGANDHSIDFGLGSAGHLSLPSGLPGASNETIQVPVHMTTLGGALASAAFSIDYASECLAIDPTDDDLDGVPDAVRYDGPAGVDLEASVETVNTEGRLDVVLSTEPANNVLGDGHILTLEFQTLCDSPPLSPQISLLEYSGTPGPVFGSADGEVWPGTSVGGSVTLYGGLRGDCSGDGSLDIADFSSHRLEIFDGDGPFWTQSLEGQFSGSPKGCDGNRDQIVDAGDLACLKRLLLGLECELLPRSGPLPRLILGPLTLQRADEERAVVQLILETPDDDVNVLAASLDLDEERFDFDPADVDGDGVPDAVRLLDGTSGNLQVDWDPSHSDGELNLTVINTGPPGEDAFPEVLRLEIEVSVLGPPPHVEQPFRFSSKPLPSLGDVEGRSIPVEDLLAPIFLDGFETGDTSRWDNTSP